MGGIVVRNLLIISAYWLVSHAVASFFSSFGILPAPIWPAAALALAASLRLGKKAAPGLYLGAFLANWLSLGAPWYTAAMIGVMNTLGPIWAAHLINRRTSSKQMLNSMPGLAVFMLVGVLLHAALTASGGILSLLLSEEIAFAGAPFAWFRWLVANASGTLFYAPFLILWMQNPSSPILGGKRVETFALAFCGLASALVIFFSPTHVSIALPGLQFLLVIPLAWAAVRLDGRVSFTIFCLLLILAQAGTTMGRGPFATHSHSHPMLAFDLMGISFAVTMLILSVLGNERNRAERRLREHNENLEHTVEQRTADLKSSKMSLEQHLEELRTAQETILKNQEDLRKSEQLLREMGTTAKVGGWQLDLLSEEVSWTDEVYRIHEVEKDFEPRLEKNLAFYVEKDRKKLMQAIDSAVAKGLNYDLELEFITAKGRKLWVRTLGDVVIQDGKPVRLFGTIQDITEKKRIEEALKQSEGFNKSIIDNSQDCINVLDKDGVLRFMSPGGLSLFEIGAIDDFLGQPYASFWENVKKVEMDRFLRDVREGAKVSFQGFMPTVKGTPKWWDVVMSPIQDSSGNLQSILVVSRDITELKMAERSLLRVKETLEQRVEERTAKLREEVEMRRLAQEALAESEIYVRSVLNSLSAHVAVLDGSANIVEANRPWVMFAEAAGITSNPEFLNWNYLEVCIASAEVGGGDQSEQARAAADGLEKVMKGELSEFVMPYACFSAGRELWFNLRITRMGGFDSARYVVAHEDITNVIAAQRALRESEERYRLVAEAMEDVVGLHDKDGRFLFVSPSSAKLMGYKPDELLGRTPFDFIHDEDSSRLSKNLSLRMAGHEGTMNRTFRWKNPIGDYVWLETITSPITDSAGDVTGFVSSSRDVSQRVEVEKRAEMLAKFPEENPNPVLRVDSSGKIRYANRSSQWLLEDLGLVVGEALPEKIWERISSVSRPGHGAGFDEMLGERHVRLTIAPTAGSESVYIYAEDVTQQKLFHQQQQMVSKVFEKSVEGIIIADADGTVQMVNRAFTGITGFEPEEVLGKEMNALRADKHSAAFMEEIWKELTESGQWTGEYWNRRKGGEAYPEWLTLSIIKDEKDRVMNYVAIFHDITEIKRSQEEIHYQAHHDALTGLPNRVLLEDRLAQALHRSQRNRTKVAVLFLDLDNFKRINDSLGHELGDEILKKTGIRLTKCIREVDTVARLGGDEFIVVLTDVVEQDMVARVAGRLLDAFKRPFTLQGRELLVSVSIGITLYPEDAVDAGELIRNADMAMYQAKEGGRSNYQLFAPAMHEEATRKMEMETELRLSLTKDDFILHFQPKVSFATGKLMGMEALVRWKPPSGKIIMPGQFIDVAEDSGLIVPLGRLVLRSACAQAKAWLDAGLDPHLVSVNLSPKQFQQKDLTDMVEDILSSTGLPPELLELEITESTVMQDVDAAVGVLGRLSRLGVSFSVDDFGTGYSSLYYLKRFPIGALKIDRSFVRDLEMDPNDQALVEAIITMSHTLNLLVVAEGVETPWQWEFLRDKNATTLRVIFSVNPCRWMKWRGCF